MTKKLKTLTICLIAGLVLSGLYVRNILAVDNEADISYAAMEKLQNISQLQEGYRGVCCGSHYPQIKCGANPICWNTASLTGSDDADPTKNLSRVLNENRGLESISADLNIATEQGDVRFRCRYQGRSTYCFAYRCEEAAPAGCKQMWRIEQKIPETDATKYKCVDVGAAESGGICQSFPAPNAGAVLAEPQCGSCQ